MRKMMRSIRVPLALGLLAVLLAGPARPARAALLQEVRDSVQEFTLENGLRFLVVERHEAPVFSYTTCVDAGGVCEIPGATGIAHMFEHMAFKGTESIGTTDYAAEKPALEAVDAAWGELRAERLKGADADSARLRQLETAFARAQEEAARFVVGNEFFGLLERNGAKDVNAFTATDATCYQYDIPSNRLELWARMEGDRLARPVMREFYKERDVVRNERRMRIESSAMGRFLESLMTAAFMAHPYAHGFSNFASDIEMFRRQDALEFFDRYYVASNMTVALVGDVDAREVQRLAEQYFGGVRRGPDPGPVTVVEPVHTAERRVLAEEDANPVVIIGWQGPAEADPDYAAAELLMQVLGGGRSSRLYGRLVKREQVATAAAAAIGLPGSKYPNLMITFAYIAADQDPARAEALIDEEVARLTEEGPTAAELQKVKTEYLAGQLRQLREPAQLALQLAMTDQARGDWRRLFEHLDRIQSVTAADLQRIARERFVTSRRTVGILSKKGAGEKAAS
jgi:predicted Zn-dependent peptidase